MSHRLVIGAVASAGLLRYVAAGDPTEFYECDANDVCTTKIKDEAEAESNNNNRAEVCDGKTNFVEEHCGRCLKSSHCKNGFC